MAGEVIVRPARTHRCAPGWKPYYVAEQHALGPGPGWYTAPPSGYDYPDGTVWQCECGKTWVAYMPTTGSPRGPGMVRFRAERRRERRRRERRAGKSQ